MEHFSRRLLTALLVGAAGPLAAGVVLVLVAPALVAAAVPDSDGVVEGVLALLVGLLVGGVLAGALAFLVGAAATVGALRATGCPHLGLAAVGCLVLTPVWAAALSAASHETLTFPAYVALVGVLPAAVRLVADHLPDRARPAPGIPIG